MNIVTLKNSFQYTNALYEWCDEVCDDPREELINIAQQIGTIALTILATLPVIFLDLSLCMISFCTKENDLADCTKEAELVDEGPDVSSINTLPDSESDEMFFEESINIALKFCPNYKDLLKEDLVDEIDIYSWASGCYVACHFASKRSPTSIFKLLAYESKEREFLDQYQNLTPSQQKKVLQKIICPEKFIEMDKSATEMLRNIQSLSSPLVQTPFFNSLLRSIQNKI
jgi:hypothetical protein